MLRGRTGDVAVADAVGDDGDVVAELGACAGRVGDANVGLGVRMWLEGEMERCGSCGIWCGMGMRTMYPDFTDFFVSTGLRKAVE